MNKEHTADSCTITLDNDEDQPFTFIASGSCLQWLSSARDNLCEQSVSLRTFLYENKKQHAAYLGECKLLTVKGNS